MRTAVVSSAEVLKAGTLDAGYWCGRKEGETPAQYKHRMEVERRSGHIWKLLVALERLDPDAAAKLVADWEAG